jgi:hypothetical protein
MHWRMQGWDAVGWLDHQCFARSQLVWQVHAALAEM